MGNIRNYWPRFWMRFAGLNCFGRVATRLAALFVPPYKSRCYLASLNAEGYIAPSANIDHSELLLGGNVFIGDLVVIYRS